VVAVLVVPAGPVLLQAVEFQRGEAIGWLAIGPLVASLALP
jgi:predicted N-acetyltransferase YhbS